jgi:formate hydrogenlyase subunit 6/NADH:ubiquinone oxidoreductase subunit I
MTSDNVSPVLNNEIGRRALFRLLLPRDRAMFSGRLELDGRKCSLCGVCAANCPTGALKTSDEKQISLIFREDLCDACGRCLEVCPEQCLKLERTFAVNEKPVVPTVLIENGLARCSRCGCVVGSQAMIEQVRTKLKRQAAASTAASDNRSMSPLLCPACKLEWNLTGAWQWTSC